MNTLKHRCASGNEEEIAPCIAGIKRGREYCAFPNLLIRNRDVPAEVLAFAAWRGTHVGNFASSELMTVRRDSKKETARRAKTKIKPPFKKFSKDAYYETLRQSRKLGLIERKQTVDPPPSENGDEDAPRRRKFGRVVEQVFLPEIGIDGFTIVCRDEFDGTLTAEQMGAYLFVLAGPGKGPQCYAREVGQRFNWGESKTSKMLRRLEAAGRIKKVVERASGAFKAVYYVPVPRRIQKTGSEKSGDGNTGSDKTGDLLNTSPHLSIPNNALKPSTKGVASATPVGLKKSDFKAIDKVMTEPMATNASATDTRALVAKTTAAAAIEDGPNRPRPRMLMDNADPTSVAGVRLTQGDLATLANLGADAEDLFDRTMAAKEKLEKRGKKLGSVRSYMLRMARNNSKAATGVEIGVVEDLATGNRFQRQAARAHIAEAHAKKLGVLAEDKVARAQRELSDRVAARFKPAISAEQRMAGLRR